MRATFRPPRPRVSRFGLAVIVVAALLGCQTQGERYPPQPEATADEPTTAATVRPVRVPPIPLRNVPEASPGDLWEPLRSAFQLDHDLDNPRVQQELRWLQSYPRYLTNLQERMQRFLPHIHEEIVARNLPGELALLPIIESGMNPQALSPRGAAGLWQFVPGTADRFDLPRTRWVDARRDPVLSTNAALDYLELLHDHLDDWYLALAAYNAGEGTVGRAIARAGGERSFWKLRLPPATRVYVPRLLALAAIVADPETYGMALPELTTESPFITVEAQGPFDLRRAAAALGVDVDSLAEWNPALNHASVPPQGPHQLHVPAAVAETAQADIDGVPTEDRADWLRVRVADGDTLSALARRHRSDVATLRVVNGLPDHRLRAGQTLLVPRPPPSGGSAGAERGLARAYQVQPGDSLWAIARAHGVSVAALAAANDLRSNATLRVGQRLTLPAAATNGAGPDAALAQAGGHHDTRRLRYGVRRGDSLSRIASHFSVAVADLLKWNDLNENDYLQPGQDLVIYVNASAE